MSEKYIVHDGDGDWTVHDSRADAVDDFDRTLDAWQERAGDSGYWDVDAELTALYRMVLIRQPEKEVLGNVRDLPEDEREAYDGILDDDAEIWRYNPRDCNTEIEALLDLLDQPSSASMDAGDLIDAAVRLSSPLIPGAQPSRADLLQAAALLVRAAASTDTP